MPPNQRKMRTSAQRKRARGARDPLVFSAMFSRSRRSVLMSCNLFLLQVRQEGAWPRPGGRAYACPFFPAASPAESASGDRLPWTIACKDGLSYGSEVRAHDVRLSEEGIDRHPRAGDEGRGTAGAQRAGDIPRMHGHKPERIRFDPACACRHLVDGGMRLEPAHRVG